MIRSVKKKSSGKEKLLSGFTQGLLGQPSIEHFAIFEGGTGKPAIMVGAISNLMYEVLPTAAMSSSINNIFYEEFFKAIWCYNWLQVQKFMTGEEGSIVWYKSLQLRSMVSGVCVWQVGKFKGIVGGRKMCVNNIIRPIVVREKISHLFLPFLLESLVEAKCR